MDVAGIVFFVMVIGVGATLQIYLSNRSRCTLEEAAQQVGCSENELRELIRAKLLTYRPQYILFGERSLNVHEIAAARVAAQEIKRIQEETDAFLRQHAEDMAAQMQEANSRYQEREAAHQAYIDMLNKIEAEILKSMSIQFMPSEVVDAFGILGLPKEAPLKEVYKSYRLLAKQHHPDVGGNSQQFIRINNAYTCIESWIQSQS